MHAGELDPNTPQTPGMHREAAIDAARAGAEKLWAGTVVIHPDAKTGPHHHGELESVIYVVSGRARMRWGERLEFTAEAGPGDFIYVPPYVPHQEINASPDDSLSCVVVRSGQEPVVVNLDMPAVEANPEEIHWVDDIHKEPEPGGGGALSGAHLGLDLAAVDRGARPRRIPRVHLVQGPLRCRHVLGRFEELDHDRGALVLIVEDLDALS